MLTTAPARGLSLTQPMNRPVEFRVWHKPTQTMHPVSTIIFDQAEIIPQLPEGATTDEWDRACEKPFQFADCVLLQFTGRQDWRGGKIFEGDVLRGDMFVPEQDWDEGETDPHYSWYEIVTYEGGAFVLSDPPHPAGVVFEVESLHARPGRVRRVIAGNIYQNPEFLEPAESWPLAPDAINYNLEPDNVPEPTV